jgi:DNA-directed RNA polymerase
MSWITPLGLPVIQPYRRPGKYVVRTLLQSYTIVLDDESLPVSASKQRSAFPPNFVHSLDATHMILTCLKMKNAGVTFASVHDSYWTHASDVPIMSEVRNYSAISLNKDIYFRILSLCYRQLESLSLNCIAKKYWRT